MAAAERDVTVTAPKALIEKAVLYGFLGLLALGQGATWREAGGSSSAVEAIKTGQAVAGETRRSMAKDIQRLADGQTTQISTQAGILSREVELRTRVEALERAVFQR